MANLYSSSSFSPSMSTASNQQNTSINSTSTNTAATSSDATGSSPNNNTINMSTSITSSLMHSASMSYLYRNPSMKPSTDYYSSNNSSLLMAKSSLTRLRSESPVDSSPNYIQILFESFLKSIRFLIMTKNVLIVPILIYLLQSKLKQFLKASTSPASSLLSSAASSFVSTATKSTKLKLDLS